MENKKIEKIIKMEKEIKELDEAINWEMDDKIANKMEKKLWKMKDKQQDLIDELSDNELDLLNKELNQKPQKKLIVKIYKKDCWIDNGIKNEKWDFTKLFYAKDEQEAEKIKNDWIKINNDNEYKIEINKVIGE